MGGNVEGSPTANAEFIVLACNTYDDLLAACQAVVDTWEHGNLAQAARQCAEALARTTRPEVQP